MSNEQLLCGQGYHSLSPLDYQDQVFKIQSTASMPVWPPAEPDPQGEELPSKHFERTYEIVWNFRLCEGNALHKAVLLQDEEVAKNEVTTILEQQPELLRSKLTWTCQPKDDLIDTPRERETGTCEAIHLAASRQSTQLVKALLLARADVNSRVTRGEQPHYDVLHAAIRNEGRGGTLEMVEYLLKERADLTLTDLNGNNALHMAFWVGSIDLINFLQDEREKQGLPDLGEPGMSIDGTPRMTPLERGFRGGKMSQDMLARCAPLTSASLSTFLKRAAEEPQCIPIFLRRCQQAARKESRSPRSSSKSSFTRHLEGCRPDELAQSVKVGNIADLLCGAPSAAVALIEACTGRPECENEGWHALPLRVRFEGSSFTHALYGLFNPAATIRPEFQTECVWEFDSINFKPPQWHDKIKNAEPPAKDLWTNFFARPVPMLDAKVEVCFIKGLLHADFFAALDTVQEEVDLVLQNKVVRGIIDYTWWNGAAKVDLALLILGMWALFVLIFETVWRHESQEAVLRREGSITADFLGARGFVDFLHELAQFAGAVKHKHGEDYLNFGNLFDVLRALSQLALWWIPGNCVVQMAVIFICWFRLLEVFTSAEHVAMVLLPITQLVSGLLPASFVTLLAFFALTHAFYIINGNTCFQQVFFETFTQLFLSDLPPLPKDNVDTLEFLLSYASIMVFTVFFLNIFIGVIGEKYTEEKENARSTLDQQRASGCLTFLYRLQVVGCRFTSPREALVIMILCGILIGAVQALSLFGWKMPKARLVYVLLQTIFVLASYQAGPSIRSRCSDQAKEEPLTPWASSNQEDYYLWVVTVDEGSEDNLQGLSFQEVEEATSMLAQSLAKQLDESEQKALLNALKEVKPESPTRQARPP